MVTLMFSFIIIIFDPSTVAAIAESDIDKQNAKGHQIRTIGAWVPSQFRLEYIKTSDQQMASQLTQSLSGTNGNISTSHRGIYCPVIILSP
jgi:hypothetical protein